MTTPAVACDAHGTRLRRARRDAPVPAVHPAQAPLPPKGEGLARATHAQPRPQPPPPSPHLGSAHRHAASALVAAVGGLQRTTTTAPPPPPRRSVIVMCWAAARDEAWFDNHPTARTAGGGGSGRLPTAPALRGPGNARGRRRANTRPPPSLPVSGAGPQHEETPMHGTPPAAAASGLDRSSAGAAGPTAWCHATLAAASGGCDSGGARRASHRQRTAQDGWR